MAEMFVNHGAEPQTTQHLVILRLLEQPCTAPDLAEFSDKGEPCAQQWPNHMELCALCLLFLWTRTEEETG